MKSCYLCGASDLQLIATQIREGEGRVVRCPQCHLVMQDLAWSTAQIKDYYNDEYQRTNSLVSGEQQNAREHFQERVKTIQPFF